MARWFFRLSSLLVVLPTACLFSYALVFTAFATLSIPQLPGWAQGHAVDWLIGEPTGSPGGGLLAPEIPKSGYEGPASFLCLLPPEIGYLTDLFGVVRPGGWIHQGIDYGTYGQNVEVRTPFGGLVVFAGWGGALGNLVVIENEGYRVYLAHLDSFAAGAGAVLEAGDPVGFSGTTGNSSGIHVHFEIRIWNGTDWTAVDPNRVLLPGQTSPCSWNTLATGR